MKKGKLIVIDGTDGSGKATQTKLLVNRFRKAGRKVKTIDFPQYYSNFFGQMIGECLIGENGNWVKVNPRVASVLYAADRWESSQKIKKWLKAGFVVVADRYASSNQVHQGGKILKTSERKKFLAWLDQLEFGIFKIPRPDLIVYLDVPVEVSRQLMAGKVFKKKQYQKGKKDLHESDETHLRDAQKNALELVKKMNNWVKIDCVKNRQLLSVQEIGELVWKAVSRK